MPNGVCACQTEGTHAQGGASVPKRGAHVPKGARGWPRGARGCQTDGAQAQGGARMPNGELTFPSGCAHAQGSARRLGRRHAGTSSRGRTFPRVACASETEGADA